jgi:hypothetical protein
MARNWAPGDAVVYRVKVLKKHWIPNPNYKTPSYERNADGRWIAVEITPDEPSTILADEVHTYYYGPYQNLGTAKGQLSRETIGLNGQRENVVGAVIEKGTIIWEEVQND